MKLKLLVYDIDHVVENGEGVARLFTVDEKGRIVIVLDNSVKPYFYVETVEEEVESIRKKMEALKHEGYQVQRVVEVEKDFYTGRKKLLMVYLRNPKEVMDVRNIVKEWPGVINEYEYTLPFYHRYLLDKGLSLMEWIEVEGESVNGNYPYPVVIAKSINKLGLPQDQGFRVLAFDIEVAEENGEEKIIMISMADNQGFKKVLTCWGEANELSHVETFGNEREMLERFVELVGERDPVFIVGYNTDRFDFLKLRDRCEALGVKLRLGLDRKEVKLVKRGRISSAKITGRVHLDLFDFIEHILSPSMKTEVLTLDAVSKELIGKGKVDVKWLEIEEAWKQKRDFEKIVSYSLRDAELTLALSHYLLPQIFSIARLTGLPPFDASRYTYSQLVEAFFMKKAVETNTLIPNRPKHEEIQQRRAQPVYKGAIVIEPEKGVHSNILVFDFAAMYPRIIVTHNISPDTLNCSCCKKERVPGLNYHFCREKKGFIPAHLEEVIRRRDKVKREMREIDKESEKYRQLDNMQFALKIIANATYGYFAYVGSRWYCRPCGESCTAWERYYINQVIKKAEEAGFSILYGDTDSVFLTLHGLSKEELIRKGMKWLKELNESLPGMIELEFRGFYVNGIFVARRGKVKGAKKRYALIDEEGELEIRGFETVRRDWCELSKEIQHEVLRIILQEKDLNKAVALVKKTIREIRERRVPLEKLIIYTQLTKPLSEYKSIGPHVKVAYKLKEKGRPVGEGMVVQFIVTKGSGSISDRSMPSEDVTIDDYDPDYYIHNQVLPASMRVLSILGISEKEILKEERQAKLGEWF